MATTNATRFLTIPADVDAAAISREGATRTVLSFAEFYRDVVMRNLPWGTAAQQDTLDTLNRLLLDAKAGGTWELREADHAALVAAMGVARSQMSPEVFLIFASFFAAVARAPNVAPEGR
jgi:hypothetical protein